MRFLFKTITVLFFSSLFSQNCPPLIANIMPTAEHRPPQTTQKFVFNRVYLTSILFRLSFVLVSDYILSVLSFVSFHCMIPLVTTDN